MLLAMGALLCGSVMQAGAVDDALSWEHLQKERSSWKAAFFEEVASESQSWSEALSFDYEAPGAVVLDDGLNFRVIVEIGVDHPVWALVDVDEGWQGLVMPGQGCPQEVPAKQIGDPIDVTRQVDRPPGGGLASNSLVLPRGCLTGGERC